MVVYMGQWTPDETQAHRELSVAEGLDGSVHLKFLAEALCRGGQILLHLRYS
jgi:hypothetical protein